VTSAHAQIREPQMALPLAHEEEVLVRGQPRLRLARKVDGERQPQERRLLRLRCAGVDGRPASADAKRLEAAREHADVRARVRRGRLVEKLRVAAVGAVREAARVADEDGVEVGLVARARALVPLAPPQPHLQVERPRQVRRRLQQHQPRVVREVAGPKEPARGLGDAFVRLCSDRVRRGDERALDANAQPPDGLERAHGEQINVEVQEARPAREAPERKLGVGVHVAPRRLRAALLQRDAHARGVREDRPQRHALEDHPPKGALQPEQSVVRLRLADRALRHGRHHHKVALGVGAADRVHERLDAVERPAARVAVPHCCVRLGRRRRRGGWGPDVAQVAGDGLEPFARLARAEVLVDVEPARPPGGGGGARRSGGGRHARLVLSTRV